MQKKHKLTREVLLQIEKLIPALPELQLCDENNQLLWDKKEVKLLGREMPRGSTYRQEKKGDLLPVEPNKRYTYTKTLPRLVNHRDRLIAAYQNDGQQGITDYIEWCQKVIDKEPELQAKERDEFNSKE